MASGGSTPPTQLNIPQLPSNFLASSADSLQTPKLSLTTPVTSINLATTGESGGKAFTSLEELLNITGINTPDYKAPGSSDNGVDSLSKIAQAVESSQQGSHDQGPPAKKPRLDSPSNIHVQPLTSPKPTQSNATIASLLHKQFSSSNHVVPSTAPSTVSTSGVNAVNTSSPMTWTEQSSGVSKSTMIVPPISTTQAVSATSQPTVSTVIPSLMQSPMSTVSGSNPKSFLLQLVQLFKHYQTQGDADGMARVKKQLNVIVSASQGRSQANPLLTALSLLTSTTSAPGLIGSNITSSMQGPMVSNTPVTSAVNFGRSLPAAIPSLPTAQTSSAGSLLSAQTQSSVSRSSAQTSLASSLPSIQTGLPTQTSLSSSLPAVLASIPSSMLSATSLSSSLSSAQASLASSLLGGVVSRPSSQTIPPSLLTNSQLKTSSATVKPPSAAVTSSVSMSKPTSNAPPRNTVTAGQGAQSSALSEQLSVQQKAVKQLQSIMATLPVASRPKTAQEIRDFVQRYSSLISQLQSANLPTTSSIQSTKATGTPQKPITSSQLTKKSALPSGPVVVPLNFNPSPSTTSATPPSTTSQLSVSNNTMAQVDQHFQNSLSVAKVKPLSTGPTPPSKPHPSAPPTVVDLTQDTEKPPSSTMSAPITTQFKGSAGNIAVPRPAGSISGGIQAGVATPLPPGLTLETLAVLCRLPESELEKLKLPVGLLSAIKVWKEKQPPATKKGSTPQSKGNTANSSIPVLFPPPMSTPLTQLKSTGGGSMKVGDAMSLTNSHPRDFKKPNMIPSSVGFPPRSLHAYVPGVGGSHTPLGTPSKLTTSTHMSGSSRPSSHHMTRYRTKADQERAEKERIQALTKALQSSEEARIVFRFSAHLDKMHSQLLSPDTTSPFANRQDMLARLLPYHVYAECEPPPAAVEKADAVFESVAQVLLSRSRGLRSRFQQLLAKSDSESGGELSVMEVELGRRFIEGEQERIQQEKLEKKQAEQVAADLSMMAKGDSGDSFDPEFSLNDAFFPFLDNGIT